jgi:hypothetical protein
MVNRKALYLGIKHASSKAVIAKFSMFVIFSQLFNQKIEYWFSSDRQIFLHKNA